MVKAALHSAFPGIETEVVYITTKGDRVYDKPLSQIGGKGLFITEIEQALLRNEIDIAVHSAKDLPVRLAGGLEITAVLKRGDARDCLVTRHCENPGNSGSFVIGTGSRRRRMFMKKQAPNAAFSDIRGNVDTRIGKLLGGEFDGIILALAGLERLGIRSDDRIDINPFELTEFLPAPCQGIIAAECRTGDDICRYLKQICDHDTYSAFETERYVIEKTGADCGVPLGAFSEVLNGKISLHISASQEKIISGSDVCENRFKLAERLVNEL